MQDYKSVCVAVMIYATLVDTQTDRQLLVIVPEQYLVLFRTGTR